MILLATFVSGKLKVNEKYESWLLGLFTNSESFSIYAILRLELKLQFAQFTRKLTLAIEQRKVLYIYIFFFIYKLLP